MMGGSDGGGQVVAAAGSGAGAAGERRRARRFVSQVLRSTEQVWTDVFRESGRTYRPPKLVLFSGSWPTACGQGQAAMGPFYCPNDQKVYIDLRFYKVLEQRSARRASSRRPTSSPTRSATTSRTSSASWTRSTRCAAAAARAQAQRAAACASSCRPTASPASGRARSQKENGWRLDPGDIEAALNAAAQIGDDTLQRKSQGTVVPESFTHGTERAARQLVQARRRERQASSAATPSRVATQSTRRSRGRAAWQPVSVERDGPVAAQDAGAVQALAQRRRRRRAGRAGRRTSPRPSRRGRGTPTGSRPSRRART